MAGPKGAERNLNWIPCGNRYSHAWWLGNRTDIHVVPPNELKLSGRFTAVRSAAVPVRWSAWLGLFAYKRLCDNDGEAKGHLKDVKDSETGMRNLYAGMIAI